VLDQHIEFITETPGPKGPPYDVVIAFRLNGGDRIEVPSDSSIDVHYDAGAGPALVTLTFFASTVRYTRDVPPEPDPGPGPDPDSER
jgi:hypothetical protein